MATPSAEPSQPRPRNGSNGGTKPKGPLAELYSVLFTPEFTIDATPVEVHDVPVASTETELLAGVDKGSAPTDVIALVSSMMRREEKAREEAESMRSLPKDDREMLSLMKHMLPVVDAFEHTLEAARSMEPTEEMTNWLKSIETLYFRLLKVLERFGLVPLKTLGQVVNLDFHDVVEYRPTANHPADTVIAERQKGWIFNNRLLRDAKVVVARPLRSR